MYKRFRLFTGETRLKGLSFFLIINILLSLLSGGIGSSISIVHAEEATGTIIQKNITHKHTGSNGSGCYTAQRTGTTTYENRCTGTLIYYPDYDSTQCSVCGAGYHGNYNSGSQCSHTDPVTTTYTYYDLGCGKSTSTVVGSFSIEYDPDTWATNIPVKVTVNDASKMKLSDNPFCMNDQVNATGDFNITDNGRYTFKIRADANANTETDKITINISKIDKTAPVIGGYSLNPDTWVNGSTIITINNVTDNQPDGGEGCGLDNLPFSYDGKNTWVGDTSYTVNENGNYDIYVRDKLGNTSTITVSVKNIDNEAPNITKCIWDETPNLLTTTVELEANDIMADGSEGSGLADKAYSYDGGKTWTADASKKITENGSYTIKVRDKVGNEASRIVNIDSLDTYGPKVTHDYWPDGWTKEYVVIDITAEDVGADNHPGSGLPKDCYSYDGGKTWGSEHIKAFRDNTTLDVAVKDNNGNITHVTIEINSIDRVAPQITLSYELSKDEHSAIINSEVIEEGSGIKDKGYIWNDGKGSNSTSLKVFKNGTYKLKVVDNLGNFSEETIDINNIKEKIIAPKPRPADNDGGNRGGGDNDGGNNDGGNPDDGTGVSEQKPDNKPIVLPIVTKPATKPYRKPIISNLAEDDDSPEEAEETDSELMEEIEDDFDIEEVVVEEDTVDSSVTFESYSRDKGGRLSPLMITLIVLGALLLLILLAWILLMLLGYAVIYCQIPGGGERFLEIVRCRRSSEYMSITVSQEIWDKADSHSFIFRFPRLFVTLHKDDSIFLMFPQDQSRRVRVEREVDITV